MKRNLLLLVFMLHGANVLSQRYYNFADSALRNIPLGDKDWLISLSIDQAGYHYDAMGNIASDNPNGIYILKKVNNQCYLQIIDGYYTGTGKIGLPLSIYDTAFEAYTPDSILKAENEFIYPYIIKNDSLQVYEAPQQSDHRPFYKIWMRTKKSVSFWDFSELDIHIPISSAERYPKNLNETYNWKTFIYRSFINFCHLLKRKFGIRQILE
ncbi:MAG: hypothetical protein QM791_03875 [Ferruginibacter sp.]